MYDGEIPTILGQEVNATVCFPGRLAGWSYSRCKYEIEIKIKKCLGYFIYNLPEAPGCEETWNTENGYCGQ